jgi:hypothetical protein
MPIFIKLTHTFQGGFPIWIRKSDIVSIYREIRLTGEKGAEESTKVETSRGHNSVKETPEEILKVLENGD